MKRLAPIFTLFLLLSCKTISNKYFTNFPDSDFRTIQQNTTRYQIDPIVLDDSYDLYIRQMCRTSPGAGYYTSGDPKRHADVTRCNCEEMNPKVTKERMEIQYLFYSERHARFILISTIPPYIDRHHGYQNTYDETLFDNHISFANINYFNLFEMGELAGNRVILSPADKDVPDHITFNFNQDKTIITYDNVRLDQYPLQNQKPADWLSVPQKYYKQKDWSIGLDDSPFINSLGPDCNNYLENKTIYLVTDKVKNSHRVFFYFEAPYAYDKDGNPWHYSMFDEKRVKSY